MTTRNHPEGTRHVTRNTQHIVWRLLRLWKLYAAMDLTFMTADLKLVLTWYISDAILNLAAVTATLLLAELIQSTSGRHEYVFDASRIKIAELLEQAAAQTQILDVETHRAPIDEVIADIYRQWQR